MGLARGLSETAVEESMTVEQIRLRFHWLQKADTRRLKLDEITITNAIHRAFKGDS